MGSNSKYQKSEEDRITNLPTCLITHILSLLPTKCAVRTSSLSSEWNNKWTSITQLRFDDALAPGTSSSPDTKASFVNFVFRVLLYHKVSCLDVFQLNCSQYYGVKYVNTWLSIALSRHAQHIDLSIPKAETGILPRCLFSSKNMVVLKLGTGFFLEVPMLISLDNIKILHLAVKFSDADSLSRLVSSCPSMEELKICGNISDNVNEVKISSNVLKRLILIGLDPHSGDLLNSQKIVLDTPGLQNLEHLDCCVPESYSVEILHCLVRARIDVGLSESQLSFVSSFCQLLRQVRVTKYARLNRTLESLLVGISRIKFLHLSMDACKVLRHFKCKLQKFPCLIELEMSKPHWELLTAFLKSSPQLATLIFEHPYNCTNQTLNPPRSVRLLKLKKIEIKNFCGQQTELDIVRYFLEKSKCLSKLLIRYPLEITKEEEVEISKKLLMLPRASASCVVSIT